MSDVSEPQTTVLFLTDSHAGAIAGAGWQQQPRRPELLPEIFQGIRSVVAAYGVDLVVHGGDITEHGTPAEISRAIDMLDSLGLPVVFCLGNHDLARRESWERWRSIAGRSRHCTLADTVHSFPTGDLDVVALNTAWSEDGQLPPGFYWDIQHGCHEGNLVEQLRWLDEQLASGGNDRPAIVITHAPLDPLPPELTGHPEPIHPAREAYARGLNEVLDRHPRVRLVFTGHNHASCVTHHAARRAHVSTSAVVEPPFELRLARFGRTFAEVRTLAAMPMRADIVYDPQRAWVNGRPGDRAFRLDWT